MFLVSKDLLVRSRGILAEWKEIMDEILHPMRNGYMHSNCASINVALVILMDTLSYDQNKILNIGTGASLFTFHWLHVSPRALDITLI